MPDRILVIEDEAISAAFIEGALTKFGYSVTNIVSNGPQAILDAEGTRPDLALMDIRIQGSMDGIETAQILRDRFNIPVVYVTAFADSDTIERAKFTEPLGYLLKPFTKADIQTSVEMALHRHREGLKTQAREDLLSATLRGIGVSVPASIDTAHEPANRISRDSATQSPRTQIAFSKPVTRTSERPGNKIAPCRTQKQKPTEEFEIVAASPAMKQVLELARRVAASAASVVLLEGETGVGKDVVAHYLHCCSERREQAFVSLNCAAIPETLLESELFGYEAGAFTDARNAKRGLLEMASGGTVFLDEIGEMPLLLQAKMLRVLDRQAFRRLGGVSDIEVDLRILAASNIGLAEAVESRRFRMDLYYRLNVVQLLIPPLRQRKEDIIPLANYFAEYYRDKLKRNHIEGFTRGALTAMLQHDWPGNVRELRNCIQRGMLLEEQNWLKPSSMGLDIQNTSRPDPPCLNAAQYPEMHCAPLPGLLEIAERRLLIEALEQTRWNQSRAAKILGISRDTLRYKIRRYSLPRPLPC